MSPGHWLLDGRPLTGPSRTRGIGTYLRGLLQGMAEMGLEERISLLLFRDDAAPPAAGVGLHLDPHPRVPRLRRRLQPVADHLLVAAALQRLRPGLFHATEWAQPLYGRTPVVVTVYDLIPFLFRGPYRWMAWERRLGLSLLRRADAVVTISQATADDVARLARVPRERITPIPLGVDPRFRPAPPDAVAVTTERLGLRRPWVLAVGTFDAHKRLEVLLDVAARLLGTGVDLVIAGDQGSYWPGVRARVAAGHLGDRVHLVGRVSDADLVALYSGARCLLHSSAYEGFGLPLLEAMACGCPVVAVAVGAVPEVCGDAALLVPDGPAAALAGALADAALATIPDGPEREARIAAGLRRAAGFTWRRTAEATVAVYRRLAGSR